MWSISCGVAKLGNVFLLLFCASAGLSGIAYGARIVVDSESIVAAKSSVANSTSSDAERAPPVQFLRDAVTNSLQFVTTAGIRQLPLPFLKGLFHTEAFQTGLLSFLEANPFFEKLVAESDLLTASACGMHFEATVQALSLIETTQGAYFQRFVCCKDCQNRVDFIVNTWGRSMNVEDAPRTMLHGAVHNILGAASRVGTGVSSIAASILNTVVDIPALLADPTLRHALLRELSNSPALRKASTPKRWMSALGLDTLTNAELVLVPPALELNGVRSAVTEVRWKPNKDKLEADHYQRWLAEDVDGLNEKVRGVIDYLTRHIGMSSLVEWVMTAFLDNIFNTLKAEGDKEKSEILMDPGTQSLLADLVNGLFAQLQVDSKASRFGFAATVLAMGVKEVTPEEIKLRNDKWTSMKCHEQIARAKEEKLEECWTSI